MATFKKFEDMQIWQDGRELVKADFNSLYAEANTLCAKIYRLIQSLTTSLTYKKL